MTNTNFRKYGTFPYNIVVVHGGPGGPGLMQAVAEKLATKHNVLEPLQTKHSVDAQINELSEAIEKHANDKVILIGSSWGAMLSYLYTANHPDKVEKLIMVGSAVFEDKYAKDIFKVRCFRLSKKERKIVHHLRKDSSTNFSGITLEKIGNYSLKTDHVNPIIDKLKILNIEKQGEIYKNVWNDFLNIRNSPYLLQLAQNITCPVVGIHGDYDPHPFLGVKIPLESRLKNFKFCLLRNCGHMPWIERDSINEFYSILYKEIRESYKH